MASRHFKASLIDNLVLLENVLLVLQKFADERHLSLTTSLRRSDVAERLKVMVSRHLACPLHLVSILSFALVSL